jgi:hypothetical protein
MTFRYRFVGFGTRFSTAAATRIAPPVDENDRRTLCDNELAVDVGGVCWGHAEVKDHVIDHHFHRDDGGQFPSAAAAVLHQAPLLAEKLGDLHGDFWLVTHRDPDFDAFCSMYLARCLIDGTIPTGDWGRFGLRADGWFRGKDDRSEIDWFRPRLDGLPADRRWPVLLAAYAAFVDNGRRLGCQRSRALHSILYAALVRGRDYGREDNGALQFFEEVRRNLADPNQGFNPLVDSVLEHSPTFAPERAMLDREVEAYRRDLRRARRSLVLLQEAKKPFGEWFPALQATPLLTEDGSTVTDHIRPPYQGRFQADGIYLRDPECLLFKEWTRLDTENSSLGQGFLFTAVAYSRGRPEGRVNQTDYFFSLDPERAGGRHLYNLWARLQAEEVHAMIRSEGKRFGGRTRDGLPRVARSGFEARARGCDAYFWDPWFDGHNYACTIVPTPNRGTVIAPAGSAHDLSDDWVARIVRQELEHSVFVGAEVVITDFAAAASVHDEPPKAVSVFEAGVLIDPPLESYYRFGRALLNDDVDTLRPEMARQIGEALWGLLDGDGSEGPAAAALNGHLVSNAQGVAVWSRRGIVVAMKRRSEKRAEALQADFRQLARLARAIDFLVAPRNDGSKTPEPENRPWWRRLRVGEVLEEWKSWFRHPMGDPRRRADHDETDPAEALRKRRLRMGETLMRRVAKLRHRLALPQSRVLRYFLDENHLGPVLETVRTVNLADIERAQATRLEENIQTVADVQKTVHWIEAFVVSVYAVELFKVLGESFEFQNDYVAWSVLGVALFTPVAFAVVLHPWRHGGVSKGLVVFLIVMAMLLAGFVDIGKICFPKVEGPKNTSGPQESGGHFPPAILGAFHRPPIPTQLPKRRQTDTPAPGPLHTASWSRTTSIST